jgi:endonuclease YncB( thermonuclease family)
VATAASGGAPALQRCAQTKGHHDGDTFVCLGAGGAGFKVRVAIIDAPETGQAYWRVASQRLRELAGDGSTVACRKEDRYGRQVCSITSLVGEDVAEVMLREGLAWYPEAYAREDTAAMRSVYRSRQAEARAAARGLWSEPQPMAPGDCRAERKTSRPCR